MGRRALASISRRLERPELLAAFDAAARQAFREEIAITAIIASTMRDDACYVDVGTNRGQLLREAVRVAPRGEHVAFEPIPALAAEVAREFPSVDCRQLAVGARAEVAEFCHFRKLEGWSGLQRSQEISDERGDPEYITVNVSTLDAELAERTPALLKIDVEGAELGVIEGARALLRRAQPLVIFEHVAAAAALYGAPAGALWDALDELGYKIFSVTGDGPFTRPAFAAGGGIVNWLARPAGPRPQA